MGDRVAYGGVAHDINNLLTVILSGVDALRRTGLSDDRKPRYIDAIAEAAERAAKLTAQLLAFARREPLREIVFDAADRPVDDPRRTFDHLRRL